MIEVRWHGRGGQGCFTVARLLGLAASIYGGKYAQAFPAFGPERRGAPVLGFTRIDEKKILDRSEVTACDYVVVLDETLISPAVTTGLKNGGTLLVNSTQPAKCPTSAQFKTVVLDATSLALEILGRPITNVPMLGALVAVSGLVSLDAVNRAIDDQMSFDLRERNKELLAKAYTLVKEVN